MKISYISKVFMKFIEEAV